MGLFLPGDLWSADVFICRIYTLDMNVLSKLVEEAKKKYYEVSRPHVIVHSVTAVGLLCLESLFMCIELISVVL